MSEAETEAREHLADVQKIEQSTAHLDQTINEAREAVQRALKAGSMRSQGDHGDEFDEYTVTDTEPGVPSEEREEDAERDGDAERPRTDDQQ